MAMRRCASALFRVPPLSSHYPHSLLGGGSSRHFSVGGGSDDLQTIADSPQANCGTAAVESSAAQPTIEPPFEPRETFRQLTKFDRFHWYPRHMSVQLKRMEGKLRTVDLIVEVHDARVALSGRNPLFGEKLYSMRPHILVLNKMDLIDLRKYKSHIEDHYRERGIKHILWTNCKRRTPKALNDLRAAMLECLRGEHRFNRTVKNEYQAMIVGIPNVGKSSLLNSLRENNLGISTKAAPEGATPGVTIRVQNRVRLLDRPLLYVLDTPGVLNPRVNNFEEGMKLAACNLILESATKPHHVADYLLYFLNKHEDFAYVRILEMPGPTNDIWRVLARVCELNDLRSRFQINGMWEERWDFDNGVNKFIGMFRAGKCGDAFLDRDHFFTPAQ